MKRARRNFLAFVKKMIYDVNSAYFKAYLSKSGGSAAAAVDRAAPRIPKAFYKAVAAGSVKPTSA